MTDRMENKIIAKKARWMSFHDHDDEKERLRHQAAHLLLSLSGTDTNLEMETKEDASQPPLNNPSICTTIDLCDSDDDDELVLQQVLFDSCSKRTTNKARLLEGTMGSSEDYDDEGIKLPAVEPRAKLGTPRKSSTDITQIPTAAILSAKKLELSSSFEDGSSSSSKEDDTKLAAVEPRAKLETPRSSIYIRKHTAILSAKKLELSSSFEDSSSSSSCSKEDDIKLRAKLGTRLRSSKDKHESTSMLRSTTKLELSRSFEVDLSSSSEDDDKLPAVVVSRDTIETARSSSKDKRKPTAIISSRTKLELSSSFEEDDDEDEQRQQALHLSCAEQDTNTVVETKGIPRVTPSAVFDLCESSDDDDDEQLQQDHRLDSFSKSAKGKLVRVELSATCTASSMLHRSDTDHYLIKPLALYRDNTQGVDASFGRMDTESDDSRASTTERSEARLHDEDDSKSDDVSSAATLDATGITSEEDIQSAAAPTRATTREETPNSSKDGFKPVAVPSAVKLEGSSKGMSSPSVLLETSDSEDDGFVLPEASPFAHKLTAKREHGLSRFNRDEDKALQMLLWQLGFGDTLHTHQCMAVRRVAGVPNDFPLHGNVKLGDSLDIHQASIGLTKHQSREPKGILLADEMGVGKTIEAIAGMILTNALGELRTGKKLPSVIISPNSAVLDQWIDALKRNGVRRHRIHKFEKGMVLQNVKDDFILMEKSKLQSELKAIFDGITKKTFTPKTSALWPSVGFHDLKKLNNQYRAAKGKAKNHYRRHRECPNDCVRRLVRGIIQRKKDLEPTFRSLIIDEAHFLKNNLAFWGIAGLLLSLHCERAIPMTGTPYNNGPQDIAALMAYIDVHLDSAKGSFWKAALKETAGDTVRSSLKEWNKQFLVRRTKDQVLTKLLGEKTIDVEVVEQHPDEIFLQEYYEAAIRKILQRFKTSLEQGNQPRGVAAQQELYTILMACISCARAAAIHPMIPSGREWTKHFSPSRRHLLASEAKKNVCVCCNQSLRPTLPIDKETEEEDGTKQGGGQPRTRRGVADMDLDDEGLDDEELEDIVREKKELLVPLPEELCLKKSNQICHFVHANCLVELKLSGESCPRCIDGARRVNMRKSDDSSFFSSKTYCKHIQIFPDQPGGFKGSSKINRIVKYVNEHIPKEDKVLVLSFFKGSLDLLEGIFVHDLGIRCARFDGDLGPAAAKQELDHFRKRPSTKILLATVQSGGTGLNIVEANHVLFVDRWFNPFVHDQAMDRCYRIGQTKDVFVKFFDCGGSIDEVMAILNKYKSHNATIVLADGTKLGANSGGGMSYQEVSGLLSRALEAVCSNRTDHINQHGRTTLLPGTNEGLIRAVLDNTVQKFKKELVTLRDVMAEDIRSDPGSNSENNSPDRGSLSENNSSVPGYFSDNSSSDPGYFFQLG